MITQCIQGLRREHKITYSTCLTTAQRTSRVSQPRAVTRIKVSHPNYSPQRLTGTDRSISKGRWDGYICGAALHFAQMAYQMATKNRNTEIENNNFYCKIIGKCVLLRQQNVRNSQVERRNKAWGATMFVTYMYVYWRLATNVVLWSTEARTDSRQILM